MFPKPIALLPLIFCIAPLSVGCNELAGRWHAHSGQRAFHGNRLDEALDAYSRALEALPGHPLLLRNLGLTHLAASRAALDPGAMTTHVEAAVTLLRSALERAPARDLAELLVNTWIESGRLSEAAAYFRGRAREGDREAWRMLGQIEAQRGDFAAAVDAYSERTRREPTDAGGWAALATLTWEWLRAGGPEDRARAMDVAARGIDAALEADRLDPKQPAALVYAGLILRQRAALDPAGAPRDLARAEELLARARARKESPAR